MKSLGSMSTFLYFEFHCLRRQNQILPVGAFTHSPLSNLFWDSVVPNPFIGPHPIRLSSTLTFTFSLFHISPSFSQNRPESKTEVSTRMSVKAAKNFLEGFGHLASSPPSPDDGKEPNIGKQHVFFKCETKVGSTLGHHHDVGN